jgi:hypothetical protein
MKEERMKARKYKGMKEGMNEGIKGRRQPNKVEPPPNEDDILVEGWNNLLLLTCHPYGILLTANIFSTDMSSLRDFLSYTNKRGINAGIACNN